MKNFLIICLISSLVACSDDSPKFSGQEPSTGVTPGGGATEQTIPENPENIESSLSDADIARNMDAFEMRRDQAFENLRGKSLQRGAVQGSISSSGIPFYRTLSYSLIDFAAKCFWLEEKNQEANDALMENCDIYVDHIEVMRDGDSFYWAADELCRIIEYWGSKGTRRAGLLKPIVEEEILKMMFQFAKDQSKINENMQICSYLYSVSAETEISQTWDVEGSENHHLMRVFSKWHFSKFLKEHATYKDQKYDDGFTPAEHYDAWNKYIKLYLKERARKGLFVEFANDLYVMESLKNIYNFYDFGDEELKGVSNKFLDLYWATWAQEQIKGVRGGSKARIYHGLNSMRGDTHFRKLAWYYFGIGSATVIKENIFSFITSDYRIPDVVMDIALDPEGKGSYEVIQRRLGLAKDGYYSPSTFYRLQTNQGLVRYSYCTPEFVMGTFHCDALPESEWTMISSQNRWMGVIFSGNHSSRIYAQCEPLNGQRGIYNQHWGAQSKGCMIAQKLINGTHSKYAVDFRIWVSDNGLKKSVEKDGWYFCHFEGESYAAIRFVSGEYKKSYLNESGLWSGNWLVAKDIYSPAIIEVARKKDIATFEEFQSRILALPLIVEKGSFTHKTLYGDEIKFYSDYRKRAEVNGKTLDLTPTKVMDSPFVQSDFNTGKYLIRKGNRRLEIDFQ